MPTAGLRRRQMNKFLASKGFPTKKSMEKRRGRGGVKSYGTAGTGRGRHRFKIG